MGQFEALLCELQVVQMKVFHPDTYVWKVGPVVLTRSAGSADTTCSTTAYPGKSRAVVEYAVMACSCSVSYAKQCANAIQAGANRVSSSCVALKDRSRIFSALTVTKQRGN